MCDELRDTIYLDHAASTPPLPGVITAMSEALEADYASPDAAHSSGRASAERIDAAARELARLLNAESDDIVWTSGATESTHLAINGVIDFQGGGHVVTAATEHRATLDVVEQRARRGLGVTILAVDGDGQIDLSELERTLASGATMLSIAHVNNETGVVAPLDRIGDLCARHDVLLHIDASQSLGRLPLDVEAIGTSLVSVSGHKTGGPKGVGALHVRSGCGLAPQLRGGGQQAGLRGGTRPTHQIVGLGEAAREARADGTAQYDRLQALDDRLWRHLSGVAGVERNGIGTNRAPGIINVSVDGVHGQALLAGLTEGEPALSVSPGSACSAARGESSHVLRAMGHTPERAAASVRFSLGWTTDETSIDHAAVRFVDEVARLRTLADAA